MLLRLSHQIRFLTLSVYRYSVPQPQNIQYQSRKNKLEEDEQEWENELKKERKEEQIEEEEEEKKAKGEQQEETDESSSDDDDDPKGGRKIPIVELVKGFIPRLIKPSQPSS